METTASDLAEHEVSDAHWDLLLSEPASLSDSDPHGLSLTAQLDLLARLQRVRARVVAREAEVLVALAGGVPHERQVRIDDPVGEARVVAIRDEVLDLVCAATHRSLGAIRRDVATARALAADLPGTRQHLAQGLITPEHAEVIARTCDGLPAHLMRRYESRVLASAPRLTPGETGTLARRVRARLDATGEERRRREAKRHIGVRVWAMDDGLACLQAVLPFAEAARLHRALDERAMTAEVDAEASVGQRRAAALVDAVCGPADRSPVERPGASRTSAAGVEIQVVVDLGALLSLERDDAAPALVRLDSGAAEPVAAGALRELLADDRVPMTLRRLVTDPITGDLLDRGRRAYRVTEAMRAFLVARDARCAFPGCTRSAQACDVDHLLPWSVGGATDRENLVPLCRRHHVQKTHSPWSAVERRPDGSVRWRGPDGREYVSTSLAPHRALGRWRPD